ncbi:hypothetical protein LIER_03547 [Lithospermum erythrorhizon]|uniref:Uncharacterized protein n=1 Tax=Lithospermum erythrorhizon TaxID=34254 RepID=A0AAV3NV27_LITER
MISTKKLIKMTRNFQIVTAINRKIELPQNNEDSSTSGHSSLPKVGEKDHFVAYTSDGRRYYIPIPIYKTTKDVEEALLLSVAANKCSSSCTVYNQETSKHALLCGF